MEPELLRCEARRPDGMGMGLWRYSLAALIIGAAMLDALWWVPARSAAPSRGARVPAVSAEQVRCHRAQLEREIAEKQAELRLIDTTW